MKIWGPEAARTLSCTSSRSSGPVFTNSGPITTKNKEKKLCQPVPTSDPRLSCTNVHSFNQCVVSPYYVLSSGLDMEILAED